MNKIITILKFTRQLGGQSGGSSIGFRDPGLFRGRVPGISSKRVARCGIAIMNATRESAILRSGIREIIT